MPEPASNGLGRGVVEPLGWDGSPWGVVHLTGLASLRYEETKVLSHPESVLRRGRIRRITILLVNAP
jgi:hypothetical protein